MYLVGITVWRRPPVLEVSALVLGDFTRNTDGAAAVGDSGREVVNWRRFVVTGQTTLVVLACKGKQNTCKLQRYNCTYHGLGYEATVLICICNLSIEINQPSCGSYALMCLMWCLESLSMAFSMSVKPPASRMDLVEKLVWAPAPFQSPWKLNETTFNKPIQFKTTYR